MKDIKRYSLTLTSAMVLCGAAAAQAPNPAAPNARGPAVQVQKALGQGEKLASNLIGATVKSTQGQNIGEVTDLVVNDKNDVVAAVVAVGGVLGVGQKKIGVRYQDFEVAPDGRTLYLNMNEEQLSQQPPFDDNVITSTAAARTRPATQTGAAEPQPSNAPVARTDTAAHDAGDHHAANQAPQNGKPGRTLKSGEQGAKALIGAEVVDKSDAKVGKIRDLIVAPGKEDVQAVVALGTAAFASTRMVTIPLGNLKIVPGKDRASEPDRVQASTMTETQIAALPEFHYE